MSSKFWFGVNWGSCAISSNDGSIVSLSQMNWFDIELTQCLRMLSVLGVQGYWMLRTLCVSMYVIFWDWQSQQDRWWSPLSVPNVLLAILETRASFSVQNTAVMHLLYESCSISFNMYLKAVYSMYVYQNESISRSTEELPKPHQRGWNWTLSFASLRLSTDLGQSCGMFQKRVCQCHHKFFAMICKPEWVGIWRSEEHLINSQLGDLGHSWMALCIDDQYFTK